MPIGPLREVRPIAPPAQRSQSSSSSSSHDGATLSKAPGDTRGERIDTTPSPFARVLMSVGKEVESGEATVRGAIAATKAGHDLGPQQLLALQAGVYRYSEAVDLAAKLVDRASSGVKTVLQGQ